MLMIAVVLMIAINKKAAAICEKRVFKITSESHNDVVEAALTDCDDSETKCQK
jgi:FlaG/FlaF family flagellin (archaellin)